MGCRPVGALSGRGNNNGMLRGGSRPRDCLYPRLLWRVIQGQRRGRPLKTTQKVGQVRVASIHVRRLPSRIRRPRTNRRIESCRMNTGCAVLRRGREGLGRGGLRTQFLGGTHGGVIVHGGRVFLTGRVGLLLNLRGGGLVNFTGQRAGSTVMYELFEGTASKGKCQSSPRISVMELTQ